MNKNNRFVKMGIAVLLAALMAGASAQTLLRAMGLPCGPIQAYLPALLAALLCGVGSLSGPMAIGSAVAAALLGALAVGANLGAVGAVREWLASMVSPDVSPDMAVLTSACALAALVVSALLGAGAFVSIDRRGGTPFALIVHAAILIGSYAMSEELSFGIAVPGLIASLAAFVFAGEVPRDAGGWRAALSAALVVALALLMVPAGRLTWEPLEKAAQTVRTTFEDYFRFTQERVPFTISTEGYNHAAEVDGNVVACLGGPAYPNEEPVMRVKTDADVLLRGAIRRTYTGNAWTDPDAKARYLYHDFTRRAVRESVLGMDHNDAFEPVNVTVEFLKTGTSSLFVPGRLREFDMDMQSAVYYNSIGEMFLSRPVEPGDAYALTGWQAGNEDALRAAVAEGMNKRDGDYEAILAAATQLPGGIEQGVYALALELTQNISNPYDKARAIEYWLKSNCVYTMTPNYPRTDRDFVSQFVMTDKEGYCSYFASAMTVMCRIAGLPARYVEGYYVKSGGAESVVVTGENAHAWTEVYFNGLGWVAFNPANGAGGGDEGLNNDEPEADSSDAQEETPPTDSAPTPTPEPTLPPQEGESQATPTPNPPDWDAQPTPPPMTPPEPEANKTHDLTWLWVLLILLLILAALALLYLWARRRLDATDPVRLSRQAENAQQAALILYRSILTLLAQTGQAPLSGEMPGAFARRIGAQTPNPDFVVFADIVAMNAYARAEVTKTAVQIGQKAYQTFEKSLKKSERLRFMLTRMFRGLGEFESIP